MVTTSLVEALSVAVARYGSASEAARAWGISKGYLSHLLSGEKSNLSDKILRRMRIVRNIKVEYIVKTDG